MVTFLLVLPDSLPTDSIFLITSIPSTICPKTTCLLSSLREMFSEYPSVFSRITHHAVLAVQMKNWDPLVLGPAFAMERIPGPVCFREKFSSANLHKFNSSRTLCIQWNPSIPTPWSEDTSVYSGTPLFQHPGVRTPLYTVEPLYSNTLE